MEPSRPSRLDGYGPSCGPSDQFEERVSAQNAAADASKRSRRGTMSETIQIQLNGKTREVSSNLTVTSLLEVFDLNPALVVVELNREILDRASFSATPSGPVTRWS